ncbi:MAG TPA: phosphoheptose isomerase [Cytophagales bacterium]|nr:phosphoheptose isomerase [Cytophagales bacterium]
MNNKEMILAELKSAADVLTQFLGATENLAKIEEAAKWMVEAVNNGGKIISCGNGGSSCDAMHFAEELTGKYREDRKAIPAISISDPGYLTCVSNDYGFDFAFSRFLEAFGNKGDVLLAISTSGDSGNVLRAANVAKMKGLKVVALTGKNGGKLAENCDLEIRVPHFGYADRIQEVHIKIIHILIFLIEKGLQPINESKA